MFEKFMKNLRQKIDLFEFWNLKIVMRWDRRVWIFKLVTFVKILLLYILWNLLTNYKYLSIN